MRYLYLIIPALFIVLLILLIFSLTKAQKSGEKAKRNILAAVIIAVILVGGFFSWRFTDVAIHPHIAINGQTFVWQGHKYSPDSSSDNNMPSGVKKIAFEKRKASSYFENLLSYIFFPYNVYESTDNKVIWEKGPAGLEKFIMSD